MLKSCPPTTGTCSSRDLLGVLDSEGLLNEVETSAAASVRVVSPLFTVAMFIVTAVKAKDIRNFVCNFDAAIFHYTTSPQWNKRNMTLVTCLTLLMNVAAMTFFTLMVFYMYERAGLHGLELWTHMSMEFVAGLFLLFNPYLYGMVFFLNHYVLELAEHQRRWRGHLQESKLLKREVTKARDLISHMQEGARLCKLVGELNAAFSPVVLVEFSFFLLVGILYGFGIAVPIFTGLDNKIKCFLVCCHGSLASLFFSIIFYQCHCGQALIFEAKKTSRELEELGLMQFDSLQVSTRYKFLSILGKIEEDIKLTSFGSIEISYSSFISLMAVIITYVIVLLQFMVSI